jgi:integrase
VPCWTTAFFAWATATQGLAYDPTAGVKGARRRKRQTHKRNPLTDAEVLRVLGQPDSGTDLGKRDRAMLHLLAYCGLGPSSCKGPSGRSGGRLTLAIYWVNGMQADLHRLAPDV